MSRFLCTCGHVIRDQTDYLPYKGEIIRDQHGFEFDNYIRETLVEYMQASRDGRRDAWLKEFFGDLYDNAKDYDDSYVVDIVIGRAQLKAELLPIYQCQECARLYVLHRAEGKEEAEYLEFAPAGHNAQVLAVPGGPIGYLGAM